jgi:hypothetical protein
MAIGEKRVVCKKKGKKKNLKTRNPNPGNYLVNPL